MAFLPELVLLATALALFVVCLGNNRLRAARRAALFGGLAVLLACGLCLGENATLFDGAYRVDAFSQFLKLIFALGFLFAILLAGELPDIRGDIRPEFFLFLSLSVAGLFMLVSSIDVITLFVALQTAAFPLYLLVPMRREREGQRVQMESAIKYVMFGIAANGVTLFGLSYLFGLTGSTSLPVMMAKLGTLAGSPLAVAGLALTFAGIFYKLAVFPFHFWTPDVYQGASHESAGIIASLPKIGAVAILIRFATLAAPDNRAIAMLLTCLAVASMFYGNLIALVQTDLKRLLGFSGIAHAGYALVGFVALDGAGYTAALYYITGYLFMTLACFVVIARVSKDGVNVAMSDLAGLHHRSPLLAVTLLVGIFALAGVPPFVGFMGKLALLKAALARGHLWLVIIAVINTAIAVYYYLCVIREAFARDTAGQSPIVLDASTRLLCWLLIIGTVALGLAPSAILDLLAASLH